MNSTEIAVVIPCYNHSNVLRRTLEALQGQTLQPREIVVVDDVSDDQPEEVVRTFPHVRCIRLAAHGGAPKARNEGARQTTAPYLLFLDADAELQPDALEVMARALDSAPHASFAYSNFFWGMKRFPAQAWNVDALKRRNYIHTSSLIRRVDFPGFDESLTKFQDWDLWLTMAEQGKSGVWVDRELYRIEPRRQGLSRWLPRIAYMIPWQKLGYQPKEVGRYRDAEAIVRKKHHM